MRPPDAGRARTSGLLARARACSGASGALSGITRTASSRRTRARPAPRPEHARTRAREAAWLAASAASQPTLFCGGGWYIDAEVADAVAEARLRRLHAPRRFRPALPRDDAPRMSGRSAGAHRARRADERLLELPSTHSLGMAARAVLGPSLGHGVIHVYFHDTDLLSRTPPRRALAAALGLLGGGAVRSTSTSSPMSRPTSPPSCPLDEVLKAGMRPVRPVRSMFRWQQGRFPRSARRPRAAAATSATSAQARRISASSGRRCASSSFRVASLVVLIVPRPVSGSRSALYAALCLARGLLRQHADPLGPALGRGERVAPVPRARHVLVFCAGGPVRAARASRRLRPGRLVARPRRADRARVRARHRARLHDLRADPDGARDRALSIGLLRASYDSSRARCCTRSASGGASCSSARASSSSHLYRDARARAAAASTTSSSARRGLARRRSSLPVLGERRRRCAAILASTPRRADPHRGGLRRAGSCSTSSSRRTAPASRCGSRRRRPSCSSSAASTCPARASPLFELRPPVLVGCDWVGQARRSTSSSRCSCSCSGCRSGSRSRPRSSSPRAGPSSTSTAGSASASASSGCSSSGRWSSTPPSGRPSSSRRTRRGGALFKIRDDPRVTRVGRAPAPLLARRDPELGQRAARRDEPRRPAAAAAARLRRCSRSGTASATSCCRG